MKPRPGGRLISLRNGSDETGLAYHTVYELVQNGHLPAVRLPNSRSIYVDRRDLEKALESWKQVGS
jgi:excisionase family DNA binding protein